MKRKRTTQQSLALANAQVASTAFTFMRKRRQDLTLGAKVKVRLHPLHLFFLIFPLYSLFLLYLIIFINQIFSFNRGGGGTVVSVRACEPRIPGLIPRYPLAIFHSLVFFCWVAKDYPNCCHTVLFSTYSRENVNIRDFTIKNLKTYAI